MKTNSIVAILLMVFAMANQMYYFIKWWDIKEKMDRMAPSIPQYILEEGRTKKELWHVSQGFTLTTLMCYCVYITVIAI